MVQTNTSDAAFLLTLVFQADESGGPSIPGSVTVTIGSPRRLQTTCEHQLVEPAEFTSYLQARRLREDNQYPASLAIYPLDAWLSPAHNSLVATSGWFDWCQVKVGCDSQEIAWFELLHWVASPSSKESSVPRHFRAVLFMDVFGDAEDPLTGEALVVSTDPAELLAEAGSAAVLRSIEGGAKLFTPLGRGAAVPGDWLPAAQCHFGGRGLKYQKWSQLGARPRVKVGQPTLVPSESPLNLGPSPTWTMLVKASGAVVYFPTTHLAQEEGT
eukprot:Skav234423  [mRNA]  locus=scaffold1656:68569:73754:- [translate_table: standard]